MIDISERKMSKLYKYSYHICWILSISIVLWGFLRAIILGKNIIDFGLLLAYLGAVFFVTPLCGIFLALNVYGFLKYRRHRYRYGLLSLVSMAWLCWSIYEIMYLPLP